MKDRPLLSGPAAERARDVAKRFSTAVLRRPPPRRYDLSAGAAGLALVHAGLEQAFPGIGHAARAGQSLSAAIRALGRATPDATLSAGCTGVAWAAELLCRGGDDGAADDDGNIDAEIAGLLAAKPWRGPYDLLSGLCGLAVYALERLPRPSAQRILAAVVDALDESATRFADGVSWRTDPSWLPAAARKPPLVAWNLGVAHGVPGVIATLGRSCASTASPATLKKARALLDGAVAWLLAQELPKGSGGCFAKGVGDGVPRTRARSAWCHGDPGIAAALMIAAQCTGEVAWEATAKRIALTAAARDPSECSATEAGLCHGAAGLGHIYHRLYRATGDPRLARAARRWLSHAVEMSDSAAPFVWTSFDGRRNVSQPGLLDGGGGVALALLAATGDADASWDRAFGVSAREP